MPIPQSSSRGSAGKRNKGPVFYGLPGFVFGMRTPESQPIVSNRMFICAWMERRAKLGSMNPFGGYQSRH